MNMDHLEKHLEQLAIHSCYCRVCCVNITQHDTAHINQLLCNVCWTKCIEYIEDISCSCVTCGKSFQTSLKDEVECPDCIDTYGM